MSVKVKITTLLLKYTEGQEIVAVDGTTPVECLDEIKSRFPKMKKWLYDKNSELRPQIWLFVNGERIFTDDIDKQLKDGDEISILLAIGGG